MPDSDIIKYLDNCEDTQNKLIQLSFILGSNKHNAPKTLENFIDTYFQCQVASAGEKGVSALLKTKGMQVFQFKENVKKVPLEELLK